VSDRPAPAQTGHAKDVDGKVTPLLAYFVIVWVADGVMGCSLRKRARGD
jgi:hypothetical protein